MMYFWCLNRSKYRLVLVLLVCSLRIRCAGAFLVGGASLRRSCNTRDGSMMLNSERTVSQQPSMSDLAREWEARNKDVSEDDSMTFSFSTPSAPTTTSAAPPAESTMADLAQEWAARNRDVDTINGEISTAIPSSTMYDSVPVQDPSPAADMTTELAAISEEPQVQETLDSFDTTNTEPRFRKIASVDKILWFDDETGEFFEAPPSVNLQEDQAMQQISTLKRFAASHGDIKALQKELEDRNTRVEGEGQYSVADGEMVGKLTSSEINEATKAAINELTDNYALSDEERKTLAAQIKSLAEPRPYPLFLAEKAVEFAEASVKDLCKPFKGPKNNPLIDGGARGGKKRIVLLGAGWAAVSFLKAIDTDLYDVRVISPRNHFVFTPMLAGASVGTVEYRSITEPIREVNRNARFMEATATDVDPETQLVTCQSVICDGNSCDICEFTVRYDRLIVTVGAQTTTFGIPGVREYCCFLKQVEDARRIRTAIVNCFERANLPGLTDEEREHDLTFAVIGAGPTGIEFAAELRDFVEQDGPKYYPHLVKYIRIKIIASSRTVLAPFDKSLQEEAIEQMNRAPRIVDPAVSRLLPPRFKLTELLFESRVKEVTDKTIILNDGSEIPYGLAVWAAGNGPIPLTLHVVEALGDEQAKEQDAARGRIAVDPWLRAVGGRGKILAVGDCSCICQGGQQLPATAQVASQQAEYLANVMNRKFDLSPLTYTTLSQEGILPPPMLDPRRTALSDRIAGLSTKNIEYAKPFQFLNLGILAYTGGSTALAQVETAPEGPQVLGSGKIGNFLWRSVYLSKQVSWRNRLLVLNDWTKKKLFGRDITRV